MLLSQGSPGSGVKPLAGMANKPPFLRFATFTPTVLPFRLGETSTPAAISRSIGRMISYPGRLDAIAPKLVVS